MFKFVQLTACRSLFSDDKLLASVNSLLEANKVKERLDGEQDRRRKIEEEANADLRAAERKSRKETESVLQRVQSLEQDVKLVQDKVANMDSKMDNVLDLLQQLRDASRESALASSTSKIADEEAH